MHEQDAEREEQRRQRYEAFLARSRDYYARYGARFKKARGVSDFPRAGVSVSGSRRRRYR
jgi:hypothetical protein